MAPATHNNQRSDEPRINYSTVVERAQCPTREQGVIVDVVDGITKDEYIMSMGQVTEPHTLLYASRISNGRFLYFVNSRETAERITGKKLKIGANILEIRPWMSKTKRVTISNANAIIPDEVIEEELKKQGIRLTSQVTRIRAGCPGEWSHVRSFRRQVYINPEDKIPPILEIIYDETTWYCYLSDTKMTCFRCKKEGHLAKYCKEELVESYVSTSTAIPLNSPSIVNDTIESSSKEKPLCNIPNDTPNLPPPSGKRPLSSTYSNSGSSVTVEKSDRKDKRSATQSTKKFKTNTKPLLTLEETVQQLSEAKKTIDSRVGEYPLDSQKIAEFLFDAYDNNNIPDTALKYTRDTPGLIKMLADIRKEVIASNLKSRIYRIIRRLDNSDRSSIKSDGANSNDENPSISNASSIASDIDTLEDGNHQT